MDPRRTFGRRAALQPAILATATRATALPVEPVLSPPTLPASSVEDEIAAWKAARGAVVPFPWRQLSLMAGLCFGIASFVLPESINDTLQWPLYALTGASFYMGLRKRK